MNQHQSEEQRLVSKMQLIQSRKYYSEVKLWDKVKDVAKKAGIQVIYLALLLFYTATSDQTPAKKKAIIFGALGYFILPLDLIPDAIPVVGFSDDLTALFACVKTVYECITPAIKQQAKVKLCEWFGKVEDDDLSNLLKQAHD